MPDVRSVSGTGLRTPSPLRAAPTSISSFPPTPASTPKQVSRPMTSDTLNGHETSSHSPVPNGDEPGLRGGENETIFQPKQPQGQPKSQVEWLSEHKEMPKLKAVQARQTVSPLPAPPTVGRVEPWTQSPFMEESDAHYDNIWRVSAYQPDFPLPDRPSGYGDIRSPGHHRFTGNPIQALPQSLVLTENGARSQHSQATDPYHYGTSRESDGDWVVNIPSPSAAYAPEEQRVFGPRLRGRTTSSTRHDPSRHEWDAPSVIERAIHAASVSMIQGLNVPVELYRGLRDTYYPPPSRPDIIKAYPVRRRLTVR